MTSARRSFVSTASPTTKRRFFMGDAIVSSKAAIYVNDASNEQTGTGTVSSSGTTVTGVGTDFDTSGLAVGDLIRSVGEIRQVTVITSATVLTVDQAFDTALPASSAYTFFEMEKVSDITNINLPQLQATQIDTSVLDTTGFRRKASGLIDPGTIDTTLYFQPQDAAHARLYNEMTNNTNLGWIIYIPDSSTNVAPPDLTNSRFYFRGSLNTFNGEVPLDGVVSVSASILIDGKPILTAGS